MAGPKRWGKGGRPPRGYSDIEPVLEALENELRDRVKESNAGKRNTESVWPVHQINWQRSRYVYDMFYTHRRISREVYDYCIRNKIADAALIAKWKKPGYEKLCSTYVINPANYKFGTTSICRVPLKDRDERQQNAQDPTTGCLGCASGRDAGRKNIFGNKYGQNLAAVQIAREKRMEEIAAARARREMEEREREREAAVVAAAEASRVRDVAQAADDDSGDSETDDSSDEDDYGPSPAAGVWAGSQKLQAESEGLAYGEDEDGGGGGSNGSNEDDSRPAKKMRATT